MGSVNKQTPYCTVSERILRLATGITTPQRRKLYTLSLATVVIIGFLSGALSMQTLGLLWIATIGLIFVAVFLKQPVWLINSLTFSIPFQIEIEVSQLSGARFTPETLGAGLLVALILVRWLSPTGKQRSALRTPNLVLFFVYLLVSSFSIAKGTASSGPAQTAWIVYRTVWISPLIYIGTWAFFRNTQSIRRAISLMTVSASIGASIAIVQTATGGRLLSGLSTNYRYLGLLTPLPPEIISSSIGSLYLSGTTLFRGHGTFFSANIFGVLLCSTIVLGWGLLSHTSTKRFWFWVGALLVQVGGLVVTFSRSAWAAAGAGALFILFVILYAKRKLTFKKTRFILIAIIGFAILLIALAFASQKIISHFLSIFTPGQVSEFQWRTYVWDYSYKHILSHPWWGMGTSLIENSDAKIPGSGKLIEFSSHNLWLDVAYQRGLIILCIFIFFSLWAMNLGWKILKKHQLNNQPEYHLMLGLVSSLLAFFVSGVGSASMLSENLATLFWFLIGSIAVLYKVIYSKDISTNRILAGTNQSCQPH